MDRNNLLRKLLILDSTALLGLLEAQITDQTKRDELVDTKGPGAQDLLDLLHAVSNEFILFSMISTWIHDHSA